MDQTELTSVQNQSPSTEGNAAPAQISQPTEKMVAQSVVNNAVQHAKQEAYEKAQKEFEVKYQHSNAPYQQNNFQQQNYLTAEDARRIAQEEWNKKQQEHDQSQRLAYGQQVLNNFYQKVEGAKQKAPDFETTVAPIVKDMEADPAGMASMIHMISGIDNGDDVLVHLASNDSKYSDILNMSQRSPNKARMALNNLSQSLKANQAAQNVPQVNTPLSQIKPSVIGKDNGSLSFQDLHNADWLRG